MISFSALMSCFISDTVSLKKACFLKNLTTKKAIVRASSKKIMAMMKNAEILDSVFSKNAFSPKSKLINAVKMKKVASKM